MRKCALALCLGWVSPGSILDVFLPHGLLSRLMVAAGHQLAVDSHFEPASELAFAVGAALAFDSWCAV